MATNLDFYAGSTSRGAPGAAQAESIQACVLVVDDNADTRLLLRVMLERRDGIRVVEAENGEMATALAENLRLDLILMDGNLPLLDGFEATRRIRGFESGREVPIIFLSGHAQEAARDKAFSAGCTDYLVKPFVFEELESMLDRYLLGHNANRLSPQQAVEGFSV